MASGCCGIGFEASNESSTRRKVESPSDALFLPTPSVITKARFDPAARQAPNPEIACYFERFLPYDQRVKTLGMNFDTKKLLAVKGDAKRGANSSA
jgi:hypothetical protein